MHPIFEHDTVTKTLSMIGIVGVIGSLLFGCSVSETPFPPFKYSIGETVETNFDKGSRFRLCKANPYFGIENAKNAYAFDRVNDKQIKINVYTVRLSCGKSIDITTEIEESELLPTKE